MVNELGMLNEMYHTLVTSGPLIMKEQVPDLQLQIKGAAPMGKRGSIETDDLSIDWLVLHSCALADGSKQYDVVVPLVTTASQVDGGYEYKAKNRQFKLDISEAEVERRLQAGYALLRQAVADYDGAGPDEIFRTYQEMLPELRKAWEKAKKARNDEIQSIVALWMIVNHPKQVRALTKESSQG